MACAGFLGLLSSFAGVNICNQFADFHLQYTFSLLVLDIKFKQYSNLLLNIVKVPFDSQFSFEKWENIVITIKYCSNKWWEITLRDVKTI